MKLNRGNFQTEKLISFVIFTILLTLGASCEKVSQDALEIDRQFHELVGNDVDFDYGLEITSNPQKLNTSDDYSITFTITNSSKNTVILSDYLANLKVFRYLGEKDEWERVYLYLGSFPKEIPLGPADDGNNNVYSFDVKLEHIDIQEDDEWLRFFITGSSEDSSSTYGNYVDLKVIQE